MHATFEHLLTLAAGTPLTLHSRSFGYPDVEQARVTSTWDKPHVWGDRYPRERQVSLSDGTHLRWVNNRITRWKGGSPCANITRIEVTADGCNR